MPPDKKKKKRRRSTTRRRNTSELDTAVGNIRKSMSSAELGPTATQRLFGGWAPPFKTAGKFRRYAWSAPTLKAGLGGVEIVRFEADNRDKLWVKLEKDTSLDSGLLDDALRAVFTEAGASTSAPNELIIQTTAARKDAIEAQVEQMLDDLRATQNDPALVLSGIEESSLGKGIKILRFSLKTEGDASKRQRKNPAETDEKGTASPPIAVLGRTPQSGGTPSTSGGKRASGSDDDDLDESSSDDSDGDQGRGFGGPGSGGGGRDDGDDRDDKRRKIREESDDEKDNDEEDPEEDSSEEEAGASPKKRERSNKRDTLPDSDAKRRRTGSKSERKWVTPSGKLGFANLRQGISLKSYSLEELESLPAVHHAYGVHPNQAELLEAWTRQQQGGDLRFYSGAPVQPLPHPLEAPVAITAELTAQQVQEILAVKSKAELTQLLDRYAKAGAVELFLAAWLHYGESNWLKSEHDSIQLIRRILTPVQNGEDAEKTITDVLKLLPQRIDKQKRAVVLETINLIQNVLKESGFVEDFGTEEELEIHAKALRDILKEKTDEFKLFLSLYDYANTLYAQFRDALESPWELPRQGQTKDSPVQKRAIILAAQLALLKQVMPSVPEGQCVFRWVEGIEHFYPGQLIAPMALWSASMGSQASEAFGGKRDRTFFMINNCRSCRINQLLTGTKNWYQREVLFPAYAQFVVRYRYEFGTSPVREVGYVLEEVDGGLQQYLQDAIPLIGMPLIEDAIPLSEEFLLHSLVDLKHRKLFEGVETLTGKELAEKDIEIEAGKELEKIPLALIYGKATHEAWSRMMRRKDNRRAILSLGMLKSYFFGLGIKLRKDEQDEEGELPATEGDVVFRDFEDGWGSDGTYFRLNEAQRSTLEGHGVLFYPTIDAGEDELRSFMSWLQDKKAKAIETIAGSKPNKAYLKDLKARIDDEEKIKLRMPVTEEQMRAYWDWKAAKKGRKARKEPYNPDEQQYEVTYGNPMDGDENVMLTNLTEALTKFSIALEQSLALYLDKKADRQEYVEWVYRFAALIQQSIVAAHPFVDGNGRLSRLVMYKVLMAYLPVEVLLENGLPLIEEPGNDLYSTKEQWADMLMKSKKMRALAPLAGRSGTSGKPDGGGGDDPADGRPGDGKSDKPQGGPSGGFGPSARGQDKGSSGQGQQPHLRATYRSAGLDGRQLQVFTTAGGGNCGIHAMHGVPNLFGTFTCSTHSDIRTNLARKILEVSNGPLKEQFVSLLNALIDQMVKNGLTDDDLQTLWDNMNDEIQELPVQLNKALALGQQDQHALQKRLEQIQLTIADLLLDGEEDTNALRDRLMTEIRDSSDNDLADLRLHLLFDPDQTQFIQLLGEIDKRRLMNLIFSNLGILIDNLPNDHGGVGQILQAYEQYQRDAEAARSLYQAFTLENYDALMRAYSKSVGENGYYLRDLDLKVLADMSGRDLIIYVENSDVRGQFVVADSTNPQGDKPVVKVFHKGQHYEHANLI